MENQLTVLPAAQVGTTPTDLLLKAIDKKLGIDQLERLMAMNDAWLARQSRAEFFSALSHFQANAPELKKTKKVSFPHRDGSGNTEYSYAPLSEISSSIKKPLSDVGLSYRWEIDDKGDSITVTAIITHLSGHTEKTTMCGKADSSGKKNEIQQRASTITYLQRYTLIGALGISSADMDNDGKGGAKVKELPPPSEKAFETTLQKVMKGEGTTEQALKFYKLTPDQEAALRKAEESTKK